MFTQPCQFVSSVRYLLRLQANRPAPLGNEVIVGYLISLESYTYPNVAYARRTYARSRPQVVVDANSIRSFVVH